MKRLLLFVSIFGLFLLAACTEKDLDDSIHPKGNSNVSTEQLSYVTVDINPSIAFTVNEDGVVVTLEALNEDGEVLLSNLTLEHPELEEAVQALIDEAIELGYIDVEADETTVEVDVVGLEERIQRVREEVKAKLEKSLKDRHINHRVQMKNYRHEWVEKAEELEITPGHYRLIQHVMLLNPELTEDDAINLSVEDLVKMVHEYRQNAREIALSMKEEFLQAKESLVEEYLPQLIAIEEAILNAENNGEPTDALREQLKDLRDLVKEKLIELHEEYKAQSKEYRESLKLRHEARRQAHMDRVRKHFERHGVRDWLEQRMKQRGHHGHHHNRP